ncbi:hypothetical protein [Candidatus Regiella endosymbiont of Tuberolachnus salignus]|uniref:hypothetical protein n=1 Tax=Candidatus Regiella endosymbiont of Tuberolachnus salignus TaxID=3077956 RepID=UPI0030D2B0CE
MLISLMALSPQRKLHSGLSGQIKLAIYGLLSLALTQCAVISFWAVINPVTR